MEQRIAYLEARNAELTAQLKRNYQLDAIAQNQELVTLKENLQRSLKLEYEDHLITLNSECNTDNYIAAQSSLKRIFKVLKRFGITF